MAEHAKGTYLVTFEGIDSIDVAERLAGCHCLVRRADLPEGALVAEGDELLGFEVYDVAAGLVGTVDGLVENPGQCLLSVRRADTEKTQASVLVPLVDAFVVGVDEEARRIEVTLPAGLLDL